MTTTLHWPHLNITGLPLSEFSANPVVIAIELLLFCYFVLVNVIDFTLIMASFRNLPRFMKAGRADTLRAVTLPFAQPVSVLLPAFNEREHILGVVESLLAMNYPEYEIIVVNDGSTDDTLDLLREKYDLVPVPEARYVRFPTARIYGLFRSSSVPNLRVIDKQNGGKGDALNAGINESRYPLIFAADGDSFYMPDTLEQMIQPFLEDSTTVGCGAALRILNDSSIVDGLPVRKGLPRKLMVRFQMLEYLRAAFNSRFGWAPLNGLMSVSGACALWKKDTLIGAGGYETNTIWEDAEMTVRVHHYMLAIRRPYRIAFVPAGVCYTTVPSALSELRRQRMSWHRHITETISRHRSMLFRSWSGLPGWFALPSYIITEWLAPLWLLVGFGFFVAAGVLGILSWEAQLALLAMVFALMLLKNAMAFFLDESSYQTYRTRDVWRLFIASLLEQFGYRQLLAFWNIAGMLQFYTKRPIRGRVKNLPSPLDPPYRPSLSQSAVR
jgi:cellulose synthase/poly-beta-1,6-N-acetylglucosamine synthase-like glycosyltransferase